MIQCTKFDLLKISLSSPGQCNTDHDCNRNQICYLRKGQDLRFPGECRKYPKVEERVSIVAALSYAQTLLYCRNLFRICRQTKVLICVDTRAIVAEITTASLRNPGIAMESVGGMGPKRGRNVTPEGTHLTQNIGPACESSLELRKVTGHENSLLWCPIKMRVFQESCLCCPHSPLSYKGKREQKGSSQFDETLSI